MLSLCNCRMKMKTSYQKQLAISLVRESFLRFQLMLITSNERALSMLFDWLLMTVKWLRNLLICLLNRYYTDYNCEEFDCYISMILIRLNLSLAGPNVGVRRWYFLWFWWFYSNSFVQKKKRTRWRQLPWGSTLC